MGTSATFRRARPLALLLLLSLLLAACGGPGGTPSTTTPGTSPTSASGAPAATTGATAAPPEPSASAGPAGGDKILKVHFQQWPNELDPQRASVSNEMAVVQLVYEGLTKLDETLQIVPAAAEGWQFNDDFTVITFTLRAGLTYSDGSPLTAHDFEYATRRALDPSFTGQYAYVLDYIVGAGELRTTPATDTVALQAASEGLGVSVPDDRTIVYRLAAPSPFFPAIASLWILDPINRGAVERGGETWYLDPANHIGNGPFILKSIEQDSRIVFEANPRYRLGRPALDGIEYRLITDASQALEAYRQGQVDIMDVDAGQIPAVQSDPELASQLVIIPQAVTAYMGFNLTLPPFDDQKVREAFSYAIDRETFCAEVRNGDCTPTLSWIPPGLPGSYEETRFAFDPEAARKALAESSYGGPEGLPEIKYAYGSDRVEAKQRAEWIAKQLLDVLGVEVTLEPYENKVLQEIIQDVETHPQMAQNAWGQDYPDPQSWLSVYWTCDSPLGGFIHAYCNEQLDALIVQADTERDQNKRMQLYVEAGKTLVADQPGIFLFNLVGYFLVKPEVSGYTATGGDSEWPGQWASGHTITVTR